MFVKFIPTKLSFKSQEMRPKKYQKKDGSKMQM